MATQSPGLLDERPELDELTRHVNVGVAWKRLGIQLKLDPKRLDAIDESKHDVADKLLAMFQLWLEGNPQATRRDVIEALGHTGQNTIAEHYKEAVGITETQQCEVTGVVKIKSSTVYILPEYIKEMYTWMNGKFAGVLSRAAQEAISEIELEEIQLFLKANCPDEASTPLVHNVSDLVTFLRKHCFLSNFGMLQSLSEEFKLVKSQNVLKTFAKERDDFYKSILAEDFAKKAIEDHQTMDDQQEMTFKVSWQPKTTLYEFEAFLRDVFHRNKIFISLRTVHHSLLTFVCTIPNWLVDEMILFVKENRDLLKFKGVLVIEVFVEKTIITVNFSGEQPPAAEPRETTLPLTTRTDPVNIKRLQADEVSVTLELHDSNISEACQAEDDTSSVTEINWAHDDTAIPQLILKKYSDRLFQLALPMELVQLLYTEGVISKEILDDVTSSGGMITSSSMEELCTTVSKDSVMLRVLGTILLKSEVTVPLANDILREYDDSQLSVYRGTQLLLYKGLTEDKLSGSNVNAASSGWSSLQELYSSLISSVRPFITSFLVQVIKFLYRVFQEMRPQLAHAETTDDVLHLIEENCSIENIYCLETVIDHYDIKAAKVPLEEYKAEFNELFEQTNIGDCLNVSFRFSSSPRLLLKCDTVEFHLSLQFLQRPLKEIRVVLSQLFNGFANRILIDSIQKMKFVVVKCSAPHLLMNVLQLEVSKTELKIKGLLSLSVGSVLLIERYEDVGLEGKIADLKEKLQDISVYNTELKNELEMERKKSSVKTLETELVKMQFRKKEDEIEHTRTANEEKEVEMRLQISLKEAETSELKERLQRISEERDDSKEREVKLLKQIEELHEKTEVANNILGNAAGPINNKPTRGELIELLSSSKFTAGTWEQFACCLPNMTQKIIADIKQREPDNLMSAVAQHWLDNSTDPTWKQVIDALKKANETALVTQVETSLDDTENVAEIRKLLQDVLIGHFSYLNNVTEHCIQNIAAEMYSRNLITKAVRNSPSYNALHDQFIAGMAAIKNISSLKQYCQLFLDCLFAVGGPVQQAAELLAKEWEQKVVRKHKKSLSLRKRQADEDSLANFTIELKSDDQVAKDLKNLQIKFPILLMNIKKYFASGRHDVTDIAQWLKEYFNEPSYTTVTSIDELFDRIQPYYHFLNCELIEDLVNVFPVDDTLQSKLEEYVSELGAFENSAQLKNMEAAVQAALTSGQETSETTCKVIIKLTGKWRYKTVNSLRILFKYLFGDKAKFLVIDCVKM